MYLQIKTCPTCKTEKSVDLFYQNVSSCKLCHNASVMRRKNNNKKNGLGHIKKNNDWKRDIQRKYGITDTEYYQLSESQNHVCAICKGTDDRGAKLAIDHCHDTNQVRGLLCRTCNVALGYLKDDITLLESALNYLKKHKEIPGIAPGIILANTTEWSV